MRLLRYTKHVYATCPNPLTLVSSCSRTVSVDTTGNLIEGAAGGGEGHHFPAGAHQPQRFVLGLQRVRPVPFSSVRSQQLTSWMRSSSRIARFPGILTFKSRLPRNACHSVQSQHDAGSGPTGRQPALWSSSLPLPKDTTIYRAHFGRTIILRSHSNPRQTGVVCRHALRPAARQHLIGLRQDASEQSHIKTFVHKPSTYAAPWVPCHAQQSDGSGSRSGWTFRASSEPSSPGGAVPRLR